MSTEKKTTLEAAIELDYDAIRYRQLKEHLRQWNDKTSLDKPLRAFEMIQEISSKELANILDFAVRHYEAAHAASLREPNPTREERENALNWLNSHADEELDRSAYETIYSCLGFPSPPSTKPEEKE